MTSIFVQSAATVNAAANDACLPFTMPDAATLFASPKKVFAHYFYVFPLSIGNTAAAQDYYNQQYLNPAGEHSKWAAQGGFLRQRPLEVGGRSGSDWQLTNVEAEIRMAIARGITGFTIDIMSVKEATDPKSHLQLLLAGAQAVDPRFKIVVMPDISALKADADAVTQIIAAVASSPVAYHLPDGRLVVTAFNAGLNGPDWWSGIFSQLAMRGINVAFVPTFLGWTQQAAKFASISYGLSDWGTATPASSASMKSAPSLAHDTYHKLFMMPVGPQQYRPKSSNYWEAGNSAAFRNAWTSSIDGNADWVQLVTWSDFSESSQVEPYTDATLRRDIGTGFYDLNAYYSAWFLTGKQPTITHDVLYYFYRREPTNAASPAQSIPVQPVFSTPENDIELLAFLASPGRLKISIGAQSFTQDAPAGITSFKVPLVPGTPTFSVSRQGAEAFSFQGGIQIVGQAGLPSGISDLTYWGGSASQAGSCTL